mmetsp:Transcript_25595/g.40429  ORF Transcript_25595/g.40429 Transcript_25595/m.40429 type:complete len:321 (+) Transcript_25595:801-1763(+)
MCVTPLALMWLAVSMTEEVVDGRGHKWSTIPLWVLILSWLPGVAVVFWFKLHSVFEWVFDGTFCGIPCCTKDTLGYARNWVIGVVMLDIIHLAPRRRKLGLAVLLFAFICLLTTTCLVTAVMVNSSSIPVFAVFTPIWFFFLILCFPFCLCEINIAFYLIFWIIIVLPVFTFVLLLSIRLETDRETLPTYAVLMPLFILDFFVPSILISVVAYDETVRRGSRICECIMMFFAVWVPTMICVVGPFVTYQVLISLWDNGTVDNFRVVSYPLYVVTSVLLVTGILFAVSACRHISRTNSTRSTFLNALTIPPELMRHTARPT